MRQLGEQWVEKAEDGKMHNEVKLIDCMEYMKTVPDKYYELAIVDPPYGWGAKLNGRNINGNAKNWNIAPTKEYFNELFRISNNHIIWGGNYFDLPQTRCLIIWDKKQPVKQFARCEIAWTNFDKNSEIFEYQYFGAINSEIGRFHPTQKPVALYKWLLKNYAKPNDKIFDSHVGSGSSRIACYDMGFDFMGCELDADYWKAQEERYKQHTMQGDLFSGSDLQSSILGGHRWQMT